MSKVYFINNNCLIPFTTVINVDFCTYGEIRIKFSHGNYTSLPRNAAKDFLTQYTAWLDSQSTPQL